MATSRNIDVLNQLLMLQRYSLPTYVEGVSPWSRAGDERAAATLAQMVAAQKAMAARIAELIIERDGRIAKGGFPMEFTDLNMLSLEYLVRESIELQRPVIAEIEGCIERLRGDAEARHLAEELLGQEKGHLENLEETTKVLV
ncbi:MAG: hypothetical protein K1X71_05360 [Pirellulales bacterium]|nr:hypothetical protein [Pirellulales bacterium]